MGRYLSANFVTYLGEKRLRCFSKISSVRKTNQRNVRSKQRSLSSSLTTPFGDLRRRGTHDTLQSVLAVRLYSTSSRDVLKTEAPIGIYQEQKSSLQLSFLGVRLGDSFQRLSKHINLYFKQSDLSINQAATSSGLVCTLHEPQRRQQRRALSQRATKDRRVLEDSSIDQSSLQLIEAAEKQPEAKTVSILYTGLQLFHPSSITTRFGESYNYVANHINSVFSRSPETDVYSNAAVFESQHQRARHGRRRKIIKVTPEARPPPVQDHILQASATPQVDSKDEEAPSSWEEGYLHFSQHINRYFGAKVSDNGSSATVNPTPKSHTLSKNLSSPPGLFHTSNDATSFGANHMQMANHINQYFNGQQGFEDDLDGDYMDLTAMAVAAPEEKPTSFMQFLMNPTTAIPEIISSYLKVSPKSQEATVDSRAKPIPTEAQLRRVVLGQSQVEDMMKVLISNLRSANTPSSIISCTEDLNRHLMAHPTCKSTVWQEKVALQLLRHRRNHASDVKLQRAIRETMALIGFLGPVKGRGVRVLSIDGGGTRGVVPLEVLKQIEAQTGKRIHELFDYMCGVSTGAVLAFMVGLGRFSLDECEDMYRRFGSDVFKQNPLVGTMKMGWTHSYYSTETWENLLKEKMGERVLIKTARSDQCPKVSAVSAVVNWGMSPKAFIFRNYNHAPGKLSRYAGGSAYKLWEAVRASSAAPGYFKEFPLHSDIHQDGGLIQNNPCAIAVHESRLLWPSQPFQCVLSLGTGRYDNAQRGPATSTSLRAKLSHLIYSATDTEGVHTLLGDLLAENVYFRFNPMLSAEVALDECRPLALDQLKADTLGYLDRNQQKLEQVCKVLSTERTTLARSKDWVSERAWELKHSWM